MASKVKSTVQAENIEMVVVKATEDPNNSVMNEQQQVVTACDQVTVNMTPEHRMDNFKISTLTLPIKWHHILAVLELLLFALCAYLIVQWANTKWERWRRESQGEDIALSRYHVPSFGSNHTDAPVIVSSSSTKAWPYRVPTWKDGAKSYGRIPAQNDQGEYENQCTDVDTPIFEYYSVCLKCQSRNLYEANLIAVYLTTRSVINSCQAYCFRTPMFKYCQQVIQLPYGAPIPKFIPPPED